MGITASKLEILRRAASADPEKFWAAAGEMLTWRQSRDVVFDWDPARPDERGRPDGARRVRRASWTKR
jgi:hypothetical protein